MAENVYILIYLYTKYAFKLHLIMIKLQTTYFVYFTR